MEELDENMVQLSQPDPITGEVTRDPDPKESMLITAKGWKKQQIAGVGSATEDIYGSRSGVSSATSRSVDRGLGWVEQLETTIVSMAEEVYHEGVGGRCRGCSSGVEGHGSPTRGEDGADVSGPARLRSSTSSSHKDDHSSMTRLLASSSSSRTRRRSSSSRTRLVSFVYVYFFSVFSIF